MAFEAIYDFTDKIAAEHAKAIKNNEYRTASTYFNTLIIYYETVVSNPKFKSQRQHCKATMMVLNPAFCEGYFENKKDGKRKIRQDTART